MILCVETNFVLELALLRDEVDDAEALLQLAEANRVELVVPAFSISEPFEAMTRRRKDRKLLLDRVSAEISELGRSKPYVTVEALSQGFTSLVANSADDETKRLREVQLRLINASTIVPLDKEIISRAIEVGPELDLTPQDSLVFASVESRLRAKRASGAVFATKNRKDFLTGDVEEQLKSLNCKLLTSFHDTRGFIESTLAGK